jgi:hypothetical protein
MFEPVGTMVENAQKTPLIRGDEVRIQACEVTDPETVHRRLPLQNDIHLLNQRRQPECGHPKALENIRLFDHPHLVSAPVTPAMASAAIKKPLPCYQIITTTTIAKTIDQDEIDCLVTNWIAACTPPRSIGLLAVRAEASLPLSLGKRRRWCRWVL